jgi:hypothetical protein
MKRLLLLLLFPLTALADGPIVGPNCLMTWDPNPASDQVTNYNVYCGTSTGQYGPPTAITGTQAACSQIGITTVGQYYCVLTAVNSIGESGQSGEAPFILLGLPNAPTNIQIQ